MTDARTEACQPTGWGTLIHRHHLDAVRVVLADRERELLELKGPCSNSACRLHYAHSGPCDCRQEVSGG